MKFLINKLPESNLARTWVSAGITAVLSLLLSLILIYVIGEYGMVLFFVIPIFMGFLSAYLYQSKMKIIRSSDAIGIGLLSLVLYILTLFVCGAEGVICIVMASPLLIILSLIGSVVACEAAKSERKKKRKGGTTMYGVIALFPLLIFYDKFQEPTLHKVKTSIVINASPETVWENVIEFPRLKKPEELMFKVGIAYPISAEIKGSGVGAIRYCNFTTGCFVEPVTVWDKPRQLAFTVKEQPASMREMSFWDIDAPHLHDYFVSKKGQFKLIKLSDGKTRLEGTTWYYHDIKPEFYWQFWSEDIVHQIHLRVLKHIKYNSEEN